MMFLSAPPARKADCAAADGQTRESFGSLRGKEQCGGRADVRADDVRSSKAPLVDQPGQERARGVRRDEFRATVGVPEPGQIDGDDPSECSDAAPDATEGPKALGPWRQEQHSAVRIRLALCEPHPHPVTDSEVRTDRRSCAGTHLKVLYTRAIAPEL